MTAIFIGILAGIGAGVGTGFAGLSAASFIAPMLVSFLDYPLYMSVGIGLASDVLASAVSSRTYYKNGNIDLKKGKVLFTFVLIFTVIGCIVAKIITDNDTGNSVLSIYSILGALCMGIRFLIWPVKEKNVSVNLHHNKEFFGSIAGGAAIGFICGFQGLGGGLMMLFILTSLLHFELPTAVGSSVFIMTFTALLGAAMHFVFNGIPDLLMLFVCVVSTYVAAKVSSQIANRISSKQMNLIVGILLTVFGFAMLVAKYVL